MTDKRGMAERRERKLRRQLELQRINDIYTVEILDPNDQDKEKERERDRNRKREKKKQ